MHIFIEVCIGLIFETVRYVIYQGFSLKERAILADIFDTFGNKRWETNK